MISGRQCHPDDDASPIILGEGSGFDAASGSFPLRELLEPKWRDHLRICKCAWLLALAQLERETGQPISARQILACRPELELKRRGCTHSSSGSSSNSGRSFRTCI